MTTKSERINWRRRALAAEREIRALRKSIINLIFHDWDALMTKRAEKCLQGTAPGT